MEQKYDANSIESLSFKDGVRTRISMYLGTPDTEGIYQALKEVVNNSTDEALMGYGDKIEITVNEEKNFVSVLDYGRGIPFQVKEDGTNVLVDIFTKAHTGGKFNNKAYTTSSGLNGIGIKATCLSSELFEAQSVRDGKIASVFFEKGVLQNYREMDNTRHLPNGTYIRFKPDKEVFIGMTDGFTFDRICSEIENISYLNKGIHFTITNDNTKETKEFYSKNGIADFIKAKATKPLMKKPIICSAKDETDELEVAFMWTGGHEESYVFVNGLMCHEGGSPITGAKTAIANQIKKLSGKSFEPELIRKGMIYAINCKVANPQFANQTKNSIGNKNLRTLASQAFKEGLEEFSRTSEFNTIIDMISRIQKAERAADKAREAILTHNKEMQNIRKSKLAFIEKLKDSRQLGEDSILLCVEGDSAASMVAKARNVDKYGLLALRGKLINCLSNPEEKYLANEEIKLLLYAMGIDINSYNPKKLRYGKIGICVDGDEDGNHISLLIMAALYRLCPQLLKENRLCWLKAPLFSEEKNGKKYYYYDEKEKQNNNHGGTIYSLKGLGSMEVEEMEESMFSDKQHLEVLEYSESAAALLEDLMGEEVMPRKNFIFKNIDFSKYTNF